MEVEYVVKEICVIYKVNKMTKTPNLYLSIGICGVVITAIYLAIRSEKNKAPRNDYDLIKDYLLNDSPLIGFDKPKLWIHTKYEQNTRKWKTFYSRNTTDLNQPYIHLTVKTIINHCGNDFNICLIDDNTFSKLIPSWDIDMHMIPEPMKQRTREYGLMQLVYFYGGMIVPNSFLCLRNLRELYNKGIAGEHPFICENVNRTTNIAASQSNPQFIPDTFILGSKKNDPIIQSYIEHIKNTNNIYSGSHFDSEIEFSGKNNQWWIQQLSEGNANLIDGRSVGVKTEDGKKILIEELTGEYYLELSNLAYGIYIPQDEILSRPHYQWFASLSGEEILDSNLILAKHLQESLVQSGDL